MGGTKISVGSTHSCLLKIDATVWCWGDNSYGQLGNGTTTSSTTPVQVVDPGVNYKSISLADTFSCGITSLDEVRCWGNNNSGQLGDGTQTSSLFPVAVQGLPSGVKSVSGAADPWGNYGYVCALLNTTAVYCWGQHPVEIGNGTNSSLTPILFPGLNSGVKNISAGRGSTCAVMNSGAVQCWGSKYLGDGSSSNSASLVTVSGITNATKIAVSGAMWGNDSLICALLDTGAVKCWGNNAAGSLGNGDLTGTLSTTPVDVVGLTDVVDIAVATGNSGGSSSVACAINSAGTLYCWGFNYWGFVGDGTTTDRFVPTPVINLHNKMTAISIGDVGDNGFGHSCALDILGNYSCWGHNSSGELGDGTTTDRNSP